MWEDRLHKSEAGDWVELGQAGGLFALSGVILVGGYPREYLRLPSVGVKQHT